jgi:CRISPR-associated protein Csb2
MSSFLCFTVRFLNPTFHGRADSDKLEWPPSPLRLFQALVAAAAARWQESRQFPECAVPALRWLEGLDDPEIVTPPSAEGSSYRLSVPNNAMDKVAGAWSRGNMSNVGDANQATHRTMKTVRPRHFRIPDDEFAAVHYLWEFTSDTAADFDRHKETLFAAARSIVALGWGIDSAVGHAQVLTGEESDKLPGERWRPATGTGGTALRTPCSGSLAALCKRHQRFLDRLPLNDGFFPVPPLTAFRVAGYRRVSDIRGHPYVAFKLLDPVFERLACFSATRANSVAAMTRHATAGSARQQPQDWVDSYVHGHQTTGKDTKPRFSYLPLPTIEHRGKSGCAVDGIRRVALAQLIEPSAKYQSWARKMLPGQFLIDNNSGERRAMLAPLNDSDWVLRQYTESSDTWATVTPVVLPGSDEGKFAKAEKLFFKSLRHAGYDPDALAELEFRNVSFWPGGDLSLSFQRPVYLMNGCWSVYHVRLRWRQAVKGPLALGAGRHCGLGIFAGTNA